MYALGNGSMDPCSLFPESGQDPTPAMHGPTKKSTDKHDNELCCEKTPSQNANLKRNSHITADKMVKRKVAALEKLEADLVNLQYKIRRDPK